MKYMRLLALSLLAMLVLGGAAAMAQRSQSSTADMYLISAKAGVVNYTEGPVSVARARGTGGLAVKGDQLEAGERLSTGANGRAEVLLNPGSYLRVGSNSAFEFQTTSLDDLRIRLAQGSAIFEVFATNEFKVSIFTPKGRVTIIDSGVYRVDVEGNGSAIVSVIEGQAVVGEKNIAIVKAGFWGTIDGGVPTTAKFDREKRDDLAEWSRSRSKDLAKMASNLKNKNVRNTLISSFNSGVWGRTRSFGLWVYDPIRGWYCFLPYYSDWYSPYGWGYGWYVPWKELPPIIQPVVNGAKPPRGHHQPPPDFDVGRNGARSGSPSGLMNTSPPTSINFDRPMPSARETVNVSPPTPPPPAPKDKPIN